MLTKKTLPWATFEVARKIQASRDGFVPRSFSKVPPGLKSWGENDSTSIVVDSSTLAEDIYLTRMLLSCRATGFRCLGLLLIWRKSDCIPSLLLTTYHRAIFVSCKLLSVELAKWCMVVRRLKRASILDFTGEQLLVQRWFVLEWKIKHSSIHVFIFCSREAIMTFRIDWSANHSWYH